jgi:hypothetical protein
VASTNVWSTSQAVPGSQSNDTNLKRGVPAIATHDGEAMVVWVSQTGAGTDIIGSRFLTGSWSATPQLLSIATDNARLDEPPALVSNGAGFVAAWVQTPYQIDMYRSRFVEGTWFSELVDAEMDNHMPALAADSHGNVLMVWDWGNVLGYQRYSSLTATWSEPEPFTGSGLIGASPLLAVAPNGTAAAVWTNRDTVSGALLDIFATIFR